MSSTEAPRATRGRVARAVEDKQRRRRRDPNDNGVVKRLHIDEQYLDREQFQYRWVVDQPGRIDLLERQDWELVAPDEVGGLPAERHADVAQNRLPLTTRLMRKYKDWFNEDHSANQKRLDAEMQAAELGKKVLNGPNDGAGLDAGESHVYTPRDANNKL